MLLDFPDAAVKGILKTLLYTLGRYHDSRSRHAVEDVIQNLTTRHFEAVIKSFVTLLNDVVEEQKRAATWWEACGAYNVLKLDHKTENWNLQIVWCSNKQFHCLLLPPLYYGDFVYKNLMVSLFLAPPALLLHWSPSAGHVSS